MNRFPKPAWFICWTVAIFTLVRLPVAAQGGDSLARDQKVLAEYRTQLQELRRGRPFFAIPDAAFFIFGMGPRAKFIYGAGKIIAWPMCQVIREWTVQREMIVPPSYSIWLSTTSGEIHIFENESGLFIDERAGRTVLAHAHVSLPMFGNNRFNLVLRVLHQEILVNIVDGRPVPNFLVYAKPWYRDGAMMAMVLKRTGNTRLIRDWIMSLREPFDYNNAGTGEPDNLGEVLFLISCVSDRHHPLVAQTLKEARNFRKNDYIVGMTDFAQHPVYQTKWLKFGLRSLGLRDDSLKVPKIKDSYASLFWWAFRDGQIGQEFTAAEARNYPYLSWARDHLSGDHTGPVSNTDYPLSWEAQASQANYAALSVISLDFTTAKVAAPHTWHAAEMFLLLADHSFQKR